MAEVQDQIVVERDVHAVYTQWARFTDFPRFMQGVERVEPLDDRRLEWEATIGGSERVWQAEITEQRPYQVIAWRSTRGAGHDGRIHFQPLDPGRTRVDVHFVYEPEGLGDKVGDALNVVELRVRGDLERFKQLVEGRHEATHGEHAGDGAAEPQRPAAGEVARSLTRTGYSGYTGTHRSEEERAAERRTKDELYELARQLGVPGRSGMTKDELAEAIARHGA